MPLHLVVFLRSPRQASHAEEQLELLAVIR